MSTVHECRCNEMKQYRVTDRHAQFNSEYSIIFHVDLSLHVDINTSPGDGKEIVLLRASNASGRRSLDSPRQLYSNRI